MIVGMKSKNIHSKIRVILLGLGAAAVIATVAPTNVQAAEVASAVITATPIGAGEYQYSVTLADTGTTTVGTYWFAWTPGDNFMPVSPTNVTSPAGWVETITSGGPSAGFAIQWKASGAASDLAAGDLLSGFSFDSTLTPAQLEAPSAGDPSDPVLTAFIYSGVPFSDAGDQVTASIAPEPAETALVGFGLAVLLVSLRRKAGLKVRS